jgi:hypothetical protein
MRKYSKFDEVWINQSVEHAVGRRHGWAHGRVHERLKPNNHEKVQHERQNHQHFAKFELVHIKIAN